MEVVAVTQALAGIAGTINAVVGGLLAINLMLIGILWNLHGSNRQLKRIADTLERRNQKEYDTVKITGGK